MNSADHTAMLAGTAKEFIDLCEKPQGLRAIIMPGSVAKGVADAYSDVELKFVWNNSSTPEQRAAIFERIDKEHLFAEELENGEWATAYVYKSIKMDVSHIDTPFLQATIDDVMDARVTSIASQTLIAAIRDSVPLYGEDVWQDLQTRTANYPKALATKCILVNASFVEWSLRRALLERNDIVALHHLIDATLLQMTRLLFALNQEYLSSYNMKWLHFYSARLTKKPARFEERIALCLSGLNESSVQELDTLLHETMALVREHRPDIDITAQMQILKYERQKFH